MSRLLKSKKLPQVLLVGFFIFAFPLAVGMRIQQWMNDPQVFFLDNDTEAKWIRSAAAFMLRAEVGFEPIRAMYRCEFELPELVSDARLTVRAFRKCQIWLDESPESNNKLFASSDDLTQWKQSYVVQLPTPLAPGRHQIWIEVTNQGAQPCLLAYSRELHLATGQHWESSVDSQRFQSAVLVDRSPPEVSETLRQFGFPRVDESLRLTWPKLMAIFGVTFALAIWNSRPKRNGARSIQARLNPRRLRWLLLVGWIVMTANNYWRVPPLWGFDINGHFDYVRFIVENHSIPMATDGWQKFQSPLTYLLASPVYALFINGLGPDACVKLLRFLPMVCGMAQIEINYRVARTVYADDEDLQTVATVVGGQLPMNLYMSQAFSNEPLAGCFTSMTILLCFSALMAPAASRHRWFFPLMGFVWGLALLSKVTPVLLTPLVVAAVLYSDRPQGTTIRWSCAQLRRTFVACFLTTGWYYVRNWVLLGKPFIGGWDPAIGIPWWQDPSYRTWKQLISFGASLKQPVYSGVMSFWDALYSSLWADGFLSGIFATSDRIPWNVEWMAVGVWLSILPQGCILAGALRMVRNGPNANRPCLLFALTALGIYLVAMIDLYVHVPIYSQAKATYMLGLLPCFGILAANGASLLLRNRWARAVFLGAISTWGTANYAAYFCL